MKKFGPFIMENGPKILSLLEKLPRLFRIVSEIVFEIKEMKKDSGGRKK